ncbi:MAG: FtsW/RodA/SpoVE family cell cycle protein [Alphaproteobacteria bacterium]|nr:FtsW/RodA/SpoVE family cell cycle protein [Alphaproteobacteria bacterium]MDA7982724.1 FtsW/RodA/SpoVE family cell cycle protein [Alphaproteobacteria bacterium]MDA7988169.1 FtsW/RodA/SpoVE family cell cycle protein [Alphaproteobacteria bacterium]MDA8008584.1 FtsW/RodA/SpoVE family cell cycle protein [Alphaproteobacteria bacterium]
MPHRLIPKRDNSVFSQWWWSADLPVLAALAALIFFGMLLSFSATQPLAASLGQQHYARAMPHMAYALVALALLVAVSFLNADAVRRAAIIACAACVVLLVATLVVGTEIKGARRWLNVFGFSVQPSEFAKPAFAVAAAWLLTAAGGRFRHPASLAAFGLCALLCGLLLLQPDIGQTVIVIFIFGAEFFVAGFSPFLVAALALLGALILLGAYHLFPHVAERINIFLDPASGDTYQVERSLEAFGAGGWRGVGLLDGQIKQKLPDRQSDFIFAVIGEEMGFVFALLVVLTFMFIAVRVLLKLSREPRAFAAVAGVGLLTQFIAQTFVNVGSSLQMIPTKGMTLPFLSHGGSSLLAMGLGMGALLALLRSPHITR